MCYLAARTMGPPWAQGETQVAEPATGWLNAHDGLRLRWLRWDAARPRGSVLVVHGFGDHAGRYRDVAGILTERGLTVAGFDQRGHGGSPGTRGDAPSFSCFLEDLDRAWAEAARVLPAPLFLWGHSFGGLVAMRWVETRCAAGMTHREAEPPASLPAGVVLSAPWLGLRMAVPRWKLAAARVLLRIAPGLPISSGSDRPEYLTRDPVRAAEYRADPLVHHRISSRFHAHLVAAQASALRAPWPAIPTLLVLPGDDRLVDTEVSRAWRARHPDVRLLVREGGRHELHNDVDRAHAIGRIGDWLDERLAAEPGTQQRVSASGP